jgi:hypothetical protein
MAQARTLTDMGATFGPIMKLSTNGTTGKLMGLLVVVADRTTCLLFLPTTQIT